VISRMATLEAINATEYGVVERAASNGSIALEWLKQCEIDVVLIDVMIISKEGLDLLKMIKTNYREIEIIIMSNDYKESPSITLDSLKAGAMDFIQKLPEKELRKRLGELKAQLKTLFTQIILKKYSVVSGNIMLTECEEVALNKGAMVNSVEQQKWEKSTRNSEMWGGIDLVLIASSTGGPVALDVIFSTFPSEIHKPILIVQHMPPEFTNLLAQKLDDKYHLHITEGKDNEILKDGKIIIAPGGQHMTIEASEGLEKVIRLMDTGFVNGVKPSADVLFQSVADIFKGKNILVVILTGMGNDGAQGIIKLKKNCNCYCITQSESTCVVYGMPKSVYEAGLSDEVADLGDIAFRIHQITLERGGR
jgi:two-component system, chemotaxis family, protein-glutamate methylesterase/glutaminase